MWTTAGGEGLRWVRWVIRWRLARHSQRVVESRGGGGVPHVDIEVVQPVRAAVASVGDADGGDHVGVQ